MQVILVCPSFHNKRFKRAPSLPEKRLDQTLEAAFKLFDSLREVGARHTVVATREGGESREGDEASEPGDLYSKVALYKEQYEKSQRSLNEVLLSLERRPASVGQQQQPNKSPGDAAARRRLVEERDMLRAELAQKTVTLREMIQKLRGLDHDLTLMRRPPLPVPPPPLRKTQ